MMTGTNLIDIKGDITTVYCQLLAFFGLAGIVYALSIGSLISFFVILTIPLFLLTLLLVINKPILLLYIIFGFNFLIIAIMRYANIEGLSLVMDILLLCQFFILFIHSGILNSVEWKNSLNVLTLVSFVWMLYCILEVINPTGMFEAWVLSRNLIFNGFLIALIASLTIVRFKEVQTLITIYSIILLLAVAKAFMQKYIGFDYAEQHWLSGNSGKTHLLSTGTRYFSFFSDAGNFGSNMGCAATIFAILSLSVNKRGLKIYYVIVSLLTLICMFFSGTRGAMIVPIGGIILYVLASKNFKALTAGSILLVGVYVFFAFTTIGQSNEMIRRMRTSFHPSKDASFNVRLENQKRLGEYLKNKPFGEGLGLSGFENQKISYRLTTEIPHDSWYVKIWVETGIVGLLLYVVGLLAVVLRCAYIIMFKINNKELRGILTAMLSGVFGLMLSAYGNAFFGQFPTMIMVYVFLSIILNGELLEKTIDENSLKQQEIKKI